MRNTEVEHVNRTRRNKLNQDIEQFIKSGGKIEHLESNLRGDLPRQIKFEINNVMSR